MPRQVLAGKTWMVTRRCLQRMFRLRPSGFLRELCPFLLAYLSEKYEVQLHAFCVMSNHFHLVLTDTMGRLPAFMRDLCAFLARALNAEQGCWETVWAPGSYSAVALETPEDVVAKMAYVLGNPAAAHLVPSGAEWEGPYGGLGMLGVPGKVVSRPTRFFRKKGPVPEKATLELVCPPGFESVEQLKALVEEALAGVEKRAAEYRRLKRRACVGRKAVREQSVFSRPLTPETRRGLNPRVAARDTWKRLEALGRLKSFLVDYRAARAAYLQGDKTVEFPAGTYWMRVAHGVRCAQA